jgi:deazaflavin-dependent oxidoreductase (nitroreductase family)
MSASALFTRRVANPLLRFVLSSQLQTPLSRSLLVLSYIGRRSGRRRATPLQYAPFGDDLALVAARASHKSWWRNFRDPAPVMITLRGRPYRAVAKVLHGDERNVGLSAFLTRYPRAPQGRLRGYSRPLGARQRKRFRQLAVTSRLQRFHIRAG